MRSGCWTTSTGWAARQQELLTLLDCGPGSAVLNVGAGIGGPARLIASVRRARVTCLEPSDDYRRAGQLLNTLTNMTELVDVFPGAAPPLPFADGSFDVVWMQNVGMSIADKPELYREVHRVLRPGGRYVFQEVVAGEAGAPIYPVS